MSMNEKSTKLNDLCKGHAARGDKDFYRLCPSKLNKRELEDLYYSLLDKNLELKREMNGKNERIRALTTKVQRMSAYSKPHLSSGKDCCVGAKALITEQKASIADLKKANDAMAERIKRLNVKLCTAKQFLKQSPLQNNKGFKSITAPSNSCRNLSSGMVIKASTDNMKSTAVSARSLASDQPERKTVETNTEAVKEEIKPEKHEKENVCAEIECKSAVEEFKKRISDLIEELSKTHAEYSCRMSHLERKVGQLQAARAQEAHARRSRGSAAALDTDLATQVSFERNKVADLEMRLKSANMSQEVAKTIAEHLKNANQLEERRAMQVEKLHDCCHPCGTASPHPCGSLPAPVPPLGQPSELAAPDAQYKSDDSGYAETRRDSYPERNIETTNQELVKRIAGLQAQLDNIKMSAHDHLQPTREPDPKAAKRDSYDVIVDELDVPVLKNVKDYNCFIIDPEKKVIIEVENVNKDTSFETFGRDLTKNAEETKGNLEPNKDISVPESLQSKREPYIKPESPECSRQLPETDFQQYDTISKQKRDIQAPYDGSRKSKVSRDLGRQEERLDIRLSRPFCEVSKPVEDKADIVQPNDPPQVQTQNGEEDNSVLPKTQAEKLKIGNNVICECPNEEPLKDNETVGHGEISKDGKNNRWPHIYCSADDISVIDKPMQNVSTPKSDRHNSMQIPGPLPVNSPKRDSYAGKIIHSSIKSKFLQGRRASTCIKDKGDTCEVKAPECRESCLSKHKLATTDTNKGDDNATDMKPVDNAAIAGPHVVFENKEEMQPNEPFHRKYFNFDNGQTNDMQNTYESPEGEIANRENPNQLSDVQKEKATETKSEIVKCFNQNCNGRRVNDKIETRLGVKDDSNQHRPSMRTREQLMAMAPNSGTFTVLSPQEKRSRATSPDNTDYEISHLSDLPTEKDGASTRVLSPGEHKTTSTTNTDSFTPYNDSSLSEGEVPNGHQKRKMSISVGEYTGDKPGNNVSYQSSAEKMEAALQAISQELARCRALLETQRSREQPLSFKDAATAPETLQKQSIALRKSEARSRISGTVVPKCIFTLHIGTIVLSDEAVINTRTTPLMLTWRFFDQNVVMTRMAAGRVVRFDFSTEYVIKITEEFIQHLKYEEMPIKICVIDENQTTFASCSLPLREALLNANRRVDISLGLVAHSLLKRKTDEVESSDEVGVLDLWCVLRAESEDLSFIRRAFDSTNKDKTTPGRQSQNIYDDLYYDYRNSQDADLFSRIYNRQTIQRDQSTFKFDEKSGVNKNNYAEPKPPSVVDSAVGAYSGMTRRRSKYAENDASVTSDLGMDSFEKRQIMASGIRYSDLKKELGPDFQRSPFRESIMIRNAAKGKVGPSGIIMTEVTPKIRSPEEMKSIWEINSLNNAEDLPNMDRRPTNIERSRRASSPAHVAVKRIPKLEPDINNKSGDKSTVTSDSARQVAYAPNRRDVTESPVITQPTIYSPNPLDNKLEITILWLTLNEECEAMSNPNVRRLYLAYSFLGRDGAELETPVSLPKPKHYGDKCFFNFKKTFYLTEFDMPILDHMAKCRSQNRNSHNSKDCVVFSVVSEPPEDPLCLDNCEDIGYAFLYLGDELAYSMGDSFTEVLPVNSAKSEDVIGVLAVRLDGLDGLRARVGRTR